MTTQILECSSPWFYHHH